MMLNNQEKRSCDVLVVGGGPVGAAVALRLARLGHHVTVAERRTESTPRSRGQSITPRARHELVELGIDPVQRVTCSVRIEAGQTFEIADIEGPFRKHLTVVEDDEGLL